MPRTILPSGIRTNNTTISDVGSGADRVISCMLHRTVIAVYRPFAGTVVLTTGGYNTPTTIRRMNECLYHWGFKSRVCKADFNGTDEMRIQSAEAQQ